MTDIIVCFRGTGKVPIDQVLLPQFGPSKQMAVPCANETHEACGGMHCDCECHTKST